MTKNKVIHARIDDNTHELLFEKCNELGCSFTYYIELIITASLEDDDLRDIELEPKPIVDSISEIRNIRIVD